MTNFVRNIKGSLLLLVIFYLPCNTLFSQQTSRDNYTGNWETPASWDPTWEVPLTVISGDICPSVTINGYITSDVSLSFISAATNLIINDTLVINGDLDLGNNNDLTINDNGILIIWGNLTVSNQTQITTNGYLIVIGNVYKGGSSFQGSWTSNEYPVNPVKLFIGGTIPASFSDNPEDYPAVTCPSPVPYPNSGCSYGNMTDLANDPIYALLQSICSMINTNKTIAVCVAETISLTSASATTYSWSGPNGFTSNLQNPTIPEATLAMSGNYKIDATNATCTDTDTINVIVSAIPETPIISASGPINLCEGNSVTLTSSAGSAYLWSTGATTQSIEVSATGNYTVQVKNEGGCLSAESAVTMVNVNAIPVTPTITADGPTTFCSGENVTLTSSAETGYLWSTGATTPSINVAATGSYTVQVVDAQGCKSAASAPAEVNVNELPLVNAGTDLTIPTGTNTTIDATVTGTGPFTYSWSPSEKLVNAFIEDPVTVNLSATTVFTLTATSITTSCSYVNTVKISVSGGPLTSNPTATPGILCAGSGIRLFALAGGGSGSYSYNWTSTPSGFTSSDADPTADPAVSTTYNVAVSDGIDTVYSQVAVTVNALPAAPIITAGGPTTLCPGGSVILTASSGTSYLWSTGETTESINVTSSGNFTVRITSASGCQSATSAVTVVLASSVTSTPVINPDGPTTFCAGDSVILTSGAGTSYLWSNGATTKSIIATESGNYTVKVTDALGCQSAASEVTSVTVNALPSAPIITTDGPTTFCSGEMVTLTSSAGAKYLWSTGSTTEKINVTMAGSYNVKIIDSNGCNSQKSEAVQVNVNALPIASAGSNSPVCVENTLNLTSSGGTVYKWSGPNGFISSIQNPSISNVITAMAGVYKVTVTSTEGCTASSTLDVAVNENPVAFAGADQDLKFFFETEMSADLSASETGKWTLVSGSARITDIHSPVTGLTELGLGKNVFTWEVISGTCKASDDVIISVEDLFIPSVITPNGDGKNEFFIINSLTVPGAKRADLIILNKWGSVEYRNKNYVNDWDGKNDRGDDLENDTYMYILRFENGFTRKGTILIAR